MTQLMLTSHSSLTADHSGGGIVSPRHLGRSTRDALARPLLLLGGENLEDGVASALRRSGWKLLRPRTLKEARLLCDQHDILAGLAFLPEPLTDSELAEVRRIVMALPDLEWVGVLDRETVVAHPGAGRFIVRHLRDYHAQPVDPIRLGLAVGHAWGLAALRRAHKQSTSNINGSRFGLVGTSPAMREIYAMIERYAETDLPVLITGETGTGKELVARAIHEHSRRAAKPFVALNCAAIPASLAQSELFGAAKGAFTGASTANEGLIRTAQGGTLLLDEIGEMALEAQASLLRFLEDKTVTPVGGRQGIAVDVNVIASTNRDLHEEARRGNFRQDLLYRLDMLSIKMPPLRDRISDIEALAEHFLEAAGDSLPHRLHGFTQDALDWLRAQDWPGNLRELRNCVIQAGLHCTHGQITAKDLSRLRPTSSAPRQSREDAVDATEKTTVEKLLKSNGGNVSKTARDLKVSRMTLYRLMAKHTIARP